MAPEGISERITLTRSQAAQTINHFAAEFHAEHGPDVDLDQINDLRRRLSWYIGGDILEVDMVSYLESLEGLDQLDRGTHPSIERNPLRTVDNTEAVRDQLEDILGFELNMLLDDAGLKGRWVRPDGSPVALVSPQAA